MENKSYDLVKITGIFSLTHFAVDFTCILMLTALMIPGLESHGQWLVCVTLYNLFAFAFQMPIGAAADAVGRGPRLSALGCLLVGLAYGMMLLPWAFGINVAAAVTAGLGNACFHVGGGLEILNRSGGRAALPGVFVSTGAMGVFLAGWVFKADFAGRSLLIICPLLILAASFLLLMGAGKICKPEPESCPDAVAAAGPAGSDEAAPSNVQSGKAEAAQHNASQDASEIVYAADTVLDAGPGKVGGCNAVPTANPMKNFRLDRAFFIICACMITTVLMRSYIGSVIHYSWKTGFLAGLIFTLGVVGGKALGGVIGDRLGWCRAGTLSLVASALCLVMGFSLPIMGIIGILLFNMTMPLTLTALGELMPGHGGLAFGMTTFALFFGILPDLFGLDDAFGGPAALAGLVLASAVIFYAGMKLFEIGRMARK